MQRKRIRLQKAAPLVTKGIIKLNSDLHQLSFTEKRVKIKDDSIGSAGSPRKKRIKIHDPRETEFYQKMCLANSRISVFKHNFMTPQT